MTQTAQCSNPESTLLAGNDGLNIVVRQTILSSELCVLVAANLNQTAVSCPKPDGSVGVLVDDGDVFMEERVGEWSTQHFSIPKPAQPGILAEPKCAVTTFE